MTCPDFVRNVNGIHTTLSPEMDTACVVIVDLLTLIMFIWFLTFLCVSNKKLSRPEKEEDVKGSGSMDENGKSSSPLVCGPQRVDINPSFTGMRGLLRCVV